MAIIDSKSDDLIVEAFGSLDVESVEIELTDFVTSALQLNPSRREALFPDNDTPVDDERSVRLDNLAASLVAGRDKVIKCDARIPKGVLFKRTDTAIDRSSYFVEGLIHYLARNGIVDPALSRFRDTESVRGYLAGIRNGDKLEAIAASLLNEMVEGSFATRRTRDQGVDCYAHDEILGLHAWCSSSSISPDLKFVGNRVHIIASCKANEGNTTNGIPAIMPPAHLRELIGSWLIQRCEHGIWHRRAAIKFLSPLQLLLVTTYRLSDESLSLCEKIGVAQWGIPELIFLFCQYAPPRVFPIAGGSKFSEKTADEWIQAAENNRIAPEPAAPVPAA